MDAALDIVSWVCFAVGGFFTLVGAFGLLRLPDVFARLHGAGMTDTMGAGLILAGLCFQASGTVVVRLVLILLFLWFTCPVSSHALARAALQGGVRPFTGRPARRQSDGGSSSKP